MITIIPVGGLCNRMRAINGAAALAERAEVPLRVVWWATWDLNAPFARLFDSSALGFEVVERGIPGRLGMKALDVAEQVKARISRDSMVITTLGSGPETFDAQAVVAAAAAGRDVWIRSLSVLADHEEPFSMFAPSPEVRARVDGIPSLSGVGNDRATWPVGVHVRRTDSTLSIKNSPMGAFERLMDAELEVDPSQGFFVATDDPESFAHLHGRYGDAVFEYSKRSYSRDDTNGVVDSAVDFWGLTRCRKIIGSFYSSFTETAASAGGAELVMALEA